MTDKHKNHFKPYDIDNPVVTIDESRKHTEEKLECTKQDDLFEYDNFFNDQTPPAITLEENITLTKSKIQQHINNILLITNAFIHSHIIVKVTVVPFLFASFFIAGAIILSTYLTIKLSVLNLILKVKK